MIILASTSPRRKEIMDFFSLPYRQISPPFDESTLLFKGDPKGYVQSLAQGKAKSVADKYPGEIILAADTIVYFENTILEKPKDKAQAIHFLMQLQGNWHEVYSGVVVMKGDEFISDVEVSRILLKDCKKTEIEKYVKKLSCLDKAGGYAIQNAGNVIVERIEGCFYNTCGLPTNALERALKVFGIELWDYLKN